MKTDNELRKVVDSFIYKSVEELEHTIIKRKCKVQLDLHNTLIVQKNKDKNYTVKLDKNGIVIEIPFNKSLEDIVDLIVEYTKVGKGEINEKVFRY